MTSEEELAARLEEDEAAALEMLADCREWTVTDCDVLTGREFVIAEVSSDRVAHHIGRHDPARALRFVAAGREILAAMEQDGHGPEFYGGLGYAVDVLARAYRGDGK